MTRSRGDALVAMIEAGVAAGLDVDTIAAGMGYSNPSNMKRAIRRLDPELARALRKTASYERIPPADELIEAMDVCGITAHHLVTEIGGSPQGFAKKLAAAGRKDLATKFYKLENFTRRGNHHGTA